MVRSEGFSVNDLKRHTKLTRTKAIKDSSSMTSFQALPSSFCQPADQCSQPACEIEELIELKNDDDPVSSVNTEILFDMLDKIEGKHFHNFPRLKNIPKIAQLRANMKDMNMTPPSSLPSISKTMPSFLNTKITTTEQKSKDFVLFPSLNNEQNNYKNLSELILKL